MLSLFLHKSSMLILRCACWMTLENIHCRKFWIFSIIMAIVVKWCGRVQRVLAEDGKLWSHLEWPNLITKKCLTSVMLLPEFKYFHAEGKQ